MPLDGTATKVSGSHQLQSGSPILIPIGPGDKPAIFNLSLNLDGALSCFLSDINNWLCQRPNNDQLIDRLVKCCKSNLQLAPVNFDLGLKSIVKDLAAWFEEIFNLLLPLLGPESAVLQLACFREQIRSKPRYARLLALVDHVEEMLSSLTSAHEVSKGALTDTLKAFAILLSLIAVLAPLRQQTLEMEHASSSTPQVLLLPISQVGFGASVSLVPSTIQSGSGNLKVYQDTLCKWGHSTINFEHTAIFYPETERLAVLENYVNCIRASRNFEIIHQSFDGSIKTGNQVPSRTPKLSGVNSVSNIIFEESFDENDDNESQLSREPLDERETQKALKSIQQDVGVYGTSQTERAREKLVSKHQSIGKRRTLVTSTNLDRTESGIPGSASEESTKKALGNGEEKACQTDEKEDEMASQKAVTSDKSCGTSMSTASTSTYSDVSPTQRQLNRVIERDTSDISSCNCEETGILGPEHGKKAQDTRSSVIDSVLQKSTRTNEEKACQTDEKEDKMALQEAVPSDKSCGPSASIASTSVNTDASPNRRQLDRNSPEALSERDKSDKSSCICEDVEVLGASSNKELRKEVMAEWQSIEVMRTSGNSARLDRALFVETRSSTIDPVLQKPMKSDEKEACQTSEKEKYSGPSASITSPSITTDVSPSQRQLDEIRLKSLIGRATSGVYMDAEEFDSSKTAKAPEEIEPESQSIVEKQTSSNVKEECHADEKEDETISKVISNMTFGCSRSIKNLSVNSDVLPFQQKCTIFQQDKLPENQSTEVREKDRKSRGRQTMLETSDLLDEASLQFLLTGGNAKQHELMVVELQKFLLRDDLRREETGARFGELLESEGSESEFVKHDDIKYDDELIEHEPSAPQITSRCESQITSTFKIKEGAPLKITQPWKLKWERYRLVRFLNRQYLREEARSFAEAHLANQVLVVDNKSDCEAFVHRRRSKLSDSSVCPLSIHSGAPIRPTRLCEDCFKRRKQLWSRQKALRDREAETFLAQKLAKESGRSREDSELCQRDMENREVAKINVASKRCSNGKVVAKITAEFPVEMMKKAVNNGKNVKFVFDVAVPEDIKDN
ncbi:hypothetical protein Aperf_G00000106630 [Anoplocephala perfoliata]